MNGSDRHDNAQCCDLHNRNCEPPSELCCWDCTEANHPNHLPGEPCVHVAFDVMQGEWRVTGSYGAKDNIVVYRKGEHFRTVTYPAYKIWNIVAHLDEVIESLESEVSS